MHGNNVLKRIIKGMVNNVMPMGLLAIFLLAVLGCGAEKKPATNNLVRAPLPAQHLSQEVTGGAFIVEPGQYKSFKVSVEPGMTKPQIEGTFSATGGNNDVEVFLLEETQYLNWQNGHKA